MEDWVECQISPLVKYRQNRKYSLTRDFILDTQTSSFIYFILTIIQTPKTILQKAPSLNIVLIYEIW